MIGIGTIGRAAESGGSTTYQNGQYIAFIISASSVYTLYYSDDFGATFKTRTTPLPNNYPAFYINYLGEMMLVYSSSLYYAASPTSNWVLIENQHTSSRCAISWDFNTIIYASGTSGTTYYLSTDKGVSFTPKSIIRSPLTNGNINSIVISGDGSKVFGSSYVGGVFINIFFNSITGVYITNSQAPSNYNFYSSDYYGNYFTGYDTSSARSCIKHLTTYTPYSLKGFASNLLECSDNGWATEYVRSDNTIRFYNPPFTTHYKSVIAPFNIRYSQERRGFVSGDYVYFGAAPSEATYLDIYKLDSIVGHSYELINRINIGSKFTLTYQAVSKVPLTLL